jgi:hypothetical protein
MPATYDSLATTTLGAISSTITFSGISSAYTDLKIVLVATANDTGRTVWLRFNSDSANNYTIAQISGNGSAVQADEQINFSAINVAGASNLSTTIPHLYDIDIFSYSGSTKKAVLCKKSGDDNGSGYVVVNAGYWNSTAAINAITLQCGNGVSQFNIGTTATLYGILRA